LSNDVKRKVGDGSTFKGTSGRQGIVYFYSFLLHYIAIPHNQTVLREATNIVENIPNVAFPVDDPTPWGKVPDGGGRKLDTE
jgi:hypothetical protein